jgi:hypothetical protein
MSSIKNIIVFFKHEKSVFNSGQGKRFLSSSAPRPKLKTAQPFIQWVPGAISPAEKLLVRGADRSSSI